VATTPERGLDSVSSTLSTSQIAKTGGLAMLFGHRVAVLTNGTTESNEDWLLRSETNIAHR
jgi:hypothetical protein